MKPMSVYLSKVMLKYQCYSVTQSSFTQNKKHTLASSSAESVTLVTLGIHYVLCIVLEEACYNVAAKF